MRIAHLSDLHIGKKLEEIDRNPEIQEVLREVVEILNREEVRIVLLTGDIFESSRPGVDSLHLFYDFLGWLKKVGVDHIFIIAGNHDNDSLLEVAKNFLENSGVHIWGRLNIRLDSYFYALNLEGEDILIAALPYLNEYQILSELGKKEEILQMSYTQRYIHTQRVLLEYFKNRVRGEKGFKIFLGHLFVEKAILSHSERESSLEKWFCVPLEIFEESNPFDYIALGHIHRPQKVSRLHPIYYAGSLIRLNFGEKEDQKGFYLLDTKSAEVRFVTLSTPWFLEEREIEIERVEDLDVLEKDPKRLWKIRVSYPPGITPLDIRKKIREKMREMVKVEIFPRHSREKTAGSVRVIRKTDDMLEYYKCFKGGEIQPEVLETLKKISQEVLKD